MYAGTFTTDDYADRVPAEHPLAGMRIRDVDDLFPQAFARPELYQAMGELVGNDHDYGMITETATFEEVDDYYNPGTEIVPRDTILEAIIVDRYSRAEKRMAAVQRTLNRHLKGREITALDPVVGKPKRSGSFAYVTVQFPFSDGQIVSVIFHSPEGDRQRITPNDTLIAFRWLLNKRDITHVVAPEDGSEVSLETVAVRVTQLVVQNAGRFAATQKDAALEQKRLDDTADAVKDAETRQEQLMDGIVRQTKEKETLDATLSNLQARLEALREAEKRRVKKTGNGTGSTGETGGTGAAETTGTTDRTGETGQQDMAGLRDAIGRLGGTLRSLALKNDWDAHYFDTETTLDRKVPAYFSHYQGSIQKKVLSAAEAIAGTLWRTYGWDKAFRPEIKPGNSELVAINKQKEGNGRHAFIEMKIYKNATYYIAATTEYVPDGKSTGQFADRSILAEGRLDVSRNGVSCDPEALAKQMNAIADAYIRYMTGQMDTSGSETPEGTSETTTETGTTGETGAGTSGETQETGGSAPVHKSIHLPGESASSHTFYVKKEDGTWEYVANQVSYGTVDAKLYPLLEAAWKVQNGEMSAAQWEAMKDGMVGTAITVSDEISRLEDEGEVALSEFRKWGWQETVYTTIDGERIPAVQKYDGRAVVRIDGSYLIGTIDGVRQDDLYKSLPNDTERIRGIVDDIDFAVQKKVIPTDPAELTYEDGAVIPKEYIPATNGTKPTQTEGISIDKLYALAEDARSEFRRVIGLAAELTGGEAYFRPGNGLKSRERVIDKINRDADGDMNRLNEIVDIHGATILYMPDVASVRRAIPRIMNILRGEDWYVRRVKDRFLKPAQGYKDVLMNVASEVIDEDGKSHMFVVEVLITTKAMSEAKMGPGHDLYEASQILEQIMNRRNEKDRKKYELTRDERKKAGAIKTILDRAMKAFYDSTGQDTSAAASVSVIRDPLQEASTLSEFLTSSSMYEKLESVLGRMRNTLPSSTSTQGMSSYSTNSRTETGSGPKYSGSSSTGNPETVRPSGNVTGNGNNMVNPPEGQNSSTDTTVENRDNLVNGKSGTGGTDVPAFVEILNEILSGKYGDDWKAIEKRLDEAVEQAEAAGLLDQYEELFSRTADEQPRAMKKAMEAFL